MVATVFIVDCRAQDYDDEVNNNNNQGDNNDNYAISFGASNDDNNVNNNMPSDQHSQNVDSEESNSRPRNSYPPAQAGSDADGDYDGDDGTAAASDETATIVKRFKRSPDSRASSMKTPLAAASEPKLRVKRHGKYYIGPVYTYVKTDKYANFKWGVSTG